MSISRQNRVTPRHLIFVAGTSPLPMYQVLAMKLGDEPRWKNVEIMVNSTSSSFLDKALSLFNDGIPEEMEITRHEYDNPGISDEEIHTLFDKISSADNSSVSLYPGLGPRSISIPLLWKHSNSLSQITVLKIIQGKEAAVIEESFQKHSAELPSRDDYLQLFGYSVFENENDDHLYLMNDEGNKIGPFLEIDYNGFLNFKYDSRTSQNLTESKEKGRQIHSLKRELEKIFGRHAINIESLQESTSRSNPETNLHTEKLTRYTFHHFFDAQNITLTCLALHQLALMFPADSQTYQIQCYVDTKRGMSVNEASQAITERLDSSKLSESQLKKIKQGLKVVNITQLDSSLQDADVVNTHLHVVNKLCGSIDGHQSLLQNLSEISVSNNITVGAFNPHSLSWKIEPRSIEDDSINRPGKIRLTDSYALSGWNLTGKKKPRWEILPREHKGKPNDTEILKDIGLFISSFTRNHQKTIFADGSSFTSSHRVLDPKCVEYSHSFLHKGSLKTGTDSLKGQYISIPMIIGRSSESEPYRMMWAPSGGVWLESICEMLIFKLFHNSNNTEILFEPKLSPISPGSGYTPEGIIQIMVNQDELEALQYIQVVWEVKSNPTWNSSDWRKYIAQASEYGNLAPYRHTIPLIIHCDENPNPEVINYAKQCKVAICAWWEIPNLREKIGNWAKENDISIPSVELLPHFDYSPNCVDEFEIEYHKDQNLPDLKIKNYEFESKFRNWYNSLSEEEKETQNKDIWVMPLLHILDKSIQSVVDEQSAKEKFESEFRNWYESLSEEERAKIEFIGTLYESLSEEERGKIEFIGTSIQPHLPMSWLDATLFFNQRLTKEEKKRYFGSEKFSITRAKKYLAKYIKIEGEANEATVEPADSPK